MSNSEETGRSPVAKGAVLSKKELLLRLDHEDPSKKLHITPMLKPSQQIGAASIDVRLGCNFVITKRSKFSSLDPLNGNIEDLGEYQEELYVKIGNRIFLHPQEFILGTTLEYVKLPSDVCAYITSRSTWGRLGLVIATATAIHPNYAGIITLELSNLGDVPIPLFPGLRIAQMIFHSSETYVPESIGTYYMSVRPSFTKVYEEPEWEAIRRILDDEC